MNSLKQANLTNLKQYIEGNHLNELKSCIEHNNVDKICFAILLVYSIENNYNIEIIDYLIGKIENEDINFKITEFKREKVPLFSAIENNHFELADILIQKYKANITYEMNNMINLLLKNSILNCKQLKYIYLRLGSKKNECIIDVSLLIKLKNNNKLLEFFFSEKRFDNDFIKQLLFIYRNSVRENNTKENINKYYQNFNTIININRKKNLVKEEMYQVAVDNNNEEALRILFENDGNDESILLNRILKFNLLEKAVSMNNFKWVESILSYEIFNYKSFKYEKIFFTAIKNQNQNIIESLCKNFIYNSSFPYRNYTRDKDTLNKSYGSCYINRVLNIFIKHGNLDLVKGLVECKEYANSINLNDKDIKDQYPIVMAINKRKVKIFQYLIDQGGSVNIKTKHKDPLLLNAIKRNDEKIVEILLNQPNIDIKEKGLNGFDAYTEAIIRGNFKIVALILNYSINHKIDIPINQKDNIGTYPLIQAINKNNFNLVVSLMQYGYKSNIDMNIDDKDDYTPLILSYNNGYMEIFKYLVKVLNINEVDSFGNNLLYYAIEKKDIDMVRFLIDSGINVNTKNKEGISIFDYTLKNKNDEILKILIENNCIPLDELDSDGNTPLIKIINSDKPDNMKNLVEIMVKNGANINIIDSDGYYPLIHAIKKKSFPIVKILVDNGSMNIEDKEGKTPLNYGLNIKYGESGPKIRKYLYDNGFKNFNFNHITSDEMSTIISHNELPILKLILNIYSDFKGKNDFSIDFDNEKLLEYAVRDGKIEIIEYLLEHGANPTNLRHYNEFHNITKRKKKTEFKEYYYLIDELISKYCPNTYGHWF